MIMKIYDFEVSDNHGGKVSLSKYKGKTLLVVNTATKCGLTPQYEALEALYKKYKDRGFEILDFPCNQFLEQAPGTDEEIGAFCTANYGTTFPRFGKIEVNGEHTAPLYKWLKSEFPKDKGDKDSQAFEQNVKQYTPDKVDGDIVWNFCKFLINRNGEIVQRFAPALTPDKLESDIEATL
jgi:glutathione peroxidase